MLLMLPCFRLFTLADYHEIYTTVILSLSGFHAITKPVGRCLKQTVEYRVQATETKKDEK